MNDPAMNFPRPTRINGRMRFSAAAIEAWAAGRAPFVPTIAGNLRALSEPIQTYSELIEALRRRRHDLGLSQCDLEAVSGLQDGYMSKLEAPSTMSYARGLGQISLPLWLGGLGVALVVVDVSNGKSKFSGQPRKADAGRG